MCATAVSSKCEKTKATRFVRFRLDYLIFRSVCLDRFPSPFHDAVPSIVKKYNGLWGTTEGRRVRGKRAAIYLHTIGRYNLVKAAHKCPST